MKEITLMEHHLGMIKTFRETPQGNYKIMKWLYDKIYTKNQFNKITDWLKSFDPDKTLVKIVSDENFYGGANIDGLCEQGCPYVNGCKKNVSTTLLKIIIRKPEYFSLYSLGCLLNNSISTIAGKSIKKEFILGRSYPLRKFIE